MVLPKKLVRSSHCTGMVKASVLVVSLAVIKLVFWWQNKRGDCKHFSIFRGALWGMICHQVSLSQTKRRWWSKKWEEAIREHTRVRRKTLMERQRQTKLFWKWNVSTCSGTHFLFFRGNNQSWPLSCSLPFVFSYWSLWSGRDPPPKSGIGLRCFCSSS